MLALLEHLISEGNYRIETWSSAGLAKVGRPFGCAGCIKYATTSSQNGDVKFDAPCRESVALSSH